MKRIATIVASLAVILGGMLTSVAPAAQAVDCSPTDPACGAPAPTPTPIAPTCSDDPAVGCEQPPLGCVRTDPAQGCLPAEETCTVDETANAYRAQALALAAKVDRLQRIADRRASTIARLRAKIRALR